mgnify:CR=1 FL=1
MGYLLYRSNRGLIDYLSVILYGTIVGFLSLSKGLLLLSFFPILILALVDQKILRFIALSLLFVLIFSLLSWARQFAQLTDMNSDLISLIGENITFNVIYENFNVITVIDVIAGRFYGAQVFALISQFQLENNFSLAVNYFMANDASLAEIIYLDLYGLSPFVREGLVIGVGIGYLGSLVFLAQDSLVLLFLFAIVTSALLHLCEQISHLFLRMDNSFSVVGIGVGLFLSATLYDGSLFRFYILVFFAIIFYLRHNQ